MLRDRRLLLALLIGAAGCGPPVAEVESSYADVRAPIDNVILYESLQSDARVGPIFQGFETRLADRLAACHVAMAIRHRLPTATTVSAPRPQAGSAGSAAPPAELTVLPWGGKYTELSNVSEAHVTARFEGSFKLELFDYRARKVTWRAVFDVKTISAPELSDGEDLADSVVARMRRDHVTRCSE